MDSHGTHQYILDLHGPRTDAVMLYGEFPEHGQVPD